MVLHNGEPVLVPWLDKVYSVPRMGHSGQEGGQAIAELTARQAQPTGQAPTLFPFGFGMSYTNFSYSDLGIKKTTATTYNVSFAVQNKGSVTGAEVPQLYIGAPDTAAQECPGVQLAVSALSGFDSVEIAPNASRTITFPISTRQLSFWSVTDRT